MAEKGRGAPVAAEVPPPNGTVAGRRQRRTVWIPLNHPDYPGWEVLAWVNAPWGLVNETSSDDEARSRAGYEALFQAHNEWQTEEGVPFPPLGDPTFWDHMDGSLLRTIVAAYKAELEQLPNSPKRT